MRVMDFVAVFSLSAAVVCSGPPCKAQTTSQALTSGQTLERPMSGGETHTYTLSLEVNQYCDIVVTQRGIDVAVSVVSPAGAKLAEVDSPNGDSGPEPVELVSTSAGTHVLRVAALEPAAKPGAYSVQVRAIRAATPNDTQLVEARRDLRRARALLAERKPREAIPLAEGALASLEKQLGPDHADLAQPLFDLADLYYQVQQFGRAEPLYVRVLAIQRRTLEPDAAAIGLTLNDLSSVYSVTGRNNESRQLLEQAVAIYEKRLGPDHLDLALALNNLGEEYRTLGLFERAEPCYARALAIRERRLGASHPRVAAVLSNQGVLARERGDTVLAEALLLRSLTIREQALGPNHPDVAQSLGNLGEIYRIRGDVDRAEQLTLRALAIKEKTLGPENPSIAVSLNNLAVLHLERDRNDEAATAFKRSLAISEKAFGPDHPFVSAILNNLAAIARKAKRTDDAVAFMTRALAIEEKIFGPDHPRVANNLTNFGLIYRDAGDLPRALEYHQRACSIRERALGPSSPDFATSLSTVASLKLATGDLEGAIAGQKQAGDVRERDFAYTLSAGSERQKLLYLDRTAHELDATISLHTLRAPGSLEARRIALEAILRRKGRALDAMVDTIASLRARATPEDRVLLDELVEARAVVSTMSLRGPGRRKVGDYRADLDAARARVDALEEKVGARSAAFRVRLAPVTLDDVQAAVPPDAVLVEFASYRAYDAVSDSVGGRRYVAYVLRSSGPSDWVDLGDANAIDRAIAAFRAAARSPKRTDVGPLGQAVHGLVMKPIVPLLGKVERVLLAPDGDLNVLPFAALVDESGAYFVERFEPVILSSGRDLLRIGRTPASLNPPLLVADPVFGVAAADASDRGLVHEAGSMSSLDGAYFGPLPGTADEARKLGKLFPGAAVLTRDGATEDAVKQATSPRILHIATHGFFLKSREPSQSDARALVHVAATGSLVDDDAARSFANPLLRSGLAFAGANVSSGQSTDGILTALEAAGLDLSGTELVVLSACDTGVGEIRNGDGVYGLRRSLVLAGSESLVMSLWPVNDAATRDLMVKYYKQLLKGRGRAEALRRVQLKMLDDDELSHPFYWAGFIESGAWGPLTGE